MKRSNRLVILVGVLLAVLAFVAIVILLNTARRGRGSGGGHRDGSRRHPGHRPRRPGHAGPRGDPGGSPRRSPGNGARRPVGRRRPARPLRDPRRIPGERARRSAPVVEATSASRASSSPVRRRSPSRWIGQPAWTSSSRAGDTIDIVVSQLINVLQETADSAANCGRERAAALRGHPRTGGRAVRQGHPPEQARPLRQRHPGDRARSRLTRTTTASSTSSMSSRLPPPSTA